MKLKETITTLEEKLISCCKYYKGEEKNPFEFWKKGAFWEFERTTVRSFIYSGKDIDIDTIDEETIKKGIKRCVSALIGKWMPYDQNLILEY